MDFLARWLFALLLGFIVFPVVVSAGAYLWQGPDENFSVLGGILLIGVLQFYHPLNLWPIPFAVGTAAACVWQCSVLRRAAGREEML